MAKRLNSTAGLPRAGRRRGAWLLLVATVLLLHGEAMRQIGARMEEFKFASTMPKRIEVAYVHELTIAEPPARVAAPAPAAPHPRQRAAKPERAASAPQAAALEPPVVVAQPEPPPAAAAPDPLPLPPPVAPPLATAPASAEPASAAIAEPTPEAALAVATQAPAAPATPATLATPAPSSTGTQAFDWPNSTRINYALTGNYRGEVQGSAQVEWIRAGARYQVHLDFLIGPSMAPLITRRMSSDGELTAEGLAPRRYDEDTKVVFRDRRRVTVLFEPDAVVLASGQRRERWPGVQDTASQFVQLSYLFTTRPELLRVGQSFEVPLALPRTIDRWVYDVVKEEVLYTSFGEVPAFHVKPRRVSRPGGELSIEIWFSPQLRYLPVRIRIEQDPETFVDLMLDRRPQIAAP